MDGERILRTDADEIVGVTLMPEGTEFTPEVRMAIKRALIAKIVADRLADEADMMQGEFFALLREAVDVAAVVSWDDQSTIFPLWEDQPDDLLEEVMSARAADDFGVLVQLIASDLDGEAIAWASTLAPENNEIAMAQSALINAVRQPIDSRS